MANTFKSITSGSIGTTLTNVYTCPDSTTSIILGASMANTDNNPIGGSIKLAKSEGGDCIIMDDGFQNPNIHKDFSIVVIDASQEFGNKRVIPSGPLRESIRRGLSRTNLIVFLFLYNLFKVGEPRIVSLFF